MEIEGSRLDSRRDIMEDAHEGHEEYHSEIMPVSERPGWWAYRYDYESQVLSNWRPSGRTMIGLVVILAGLIVLLLLLSWLLGFYLIK